MASYAEATKKPLGNVTVYDDLQSAVKNAWLVFEVVPEKLNIKIETFAELEKLVCNCSQKVVVSMYMMLTILRVQGTERLYPCIQFVVL